MRKILLILFSLCCMVLNATPSPDTKELINELVRAIDNSEAAIERKWEYIKEIRENIPQTRDLTRERYDLYYHLATAYSNFVADSSVLYYDKAQVVAHKMGLSKLSDEAGIAKAGMLTMAGYYYEASVVLDALDRGALDADVLPRFYSAKADLYHALYLQNHFDAQMHNSFVRSYTEYRDSLLAVGDPVDVMVLRQKEKICARNKEFDEALAFNSMRMEALKNDSLSLALVYYDRYAIKYVYGRLPVQDYIDDLLMSAILDVNSVNQEIASLLPLEEYLLSSNMVKQAKKVSDYYYATMVRFGSKLRRINGFDQTVAISNEQIDILVRQRRIIYTVMILLAILVVGILIALLYVIDTKRKMVLLNYRLTRSEKEAKTYMTQFFILYSSYVESMLAFRMKISTLLHKGNVSRAIELTSPSKERENEDLHSLHHNFDMAFVAIHSDYVEKFNSMLKEECKIELKPGEILSLELRIFALIKMGVGDSAEIAKILHCSIKTVYNKRSEIKPKLAIPLDEFYKKLSEI